MSRIPPVADASATAEQRALFQGIQAQMGMTPNFLRVLGQSPAALQAYLGLAAISGGGALAAATRERIAIALAQGNACEYCLSAHSALGRAAGLDDREIDSNRAGSSQDAKAAAAVKFAKSLAEHTGEVTTGEIDAVRAAGYGDAELVEIVVHVGMNMLINILGKASRVDIDFPRVALDRPLAAA